MHKLTLLIPTYNRTPYLQRLLPYLTTYLDSTLVKINVLDGSSDLALAAGNAQLCQKFSAGYKFYHQEISYQQRIRDGIKKADTPYVMLHADDDFVNPSGLYQSLKYLDQHPDYVSAHGKYVGFSLANGNLLFQDFYIAPYYPKQISLKEEYSLKRLFNCMYHYLPIHYAVHRRQSLEKAYDELVQHLDGVDEDYFFDELMVAAIMSLSGKIKQLPGFFMAKEIGQSLPRNCRLIERYLIHGNFFTKYEKFFAGVHNQICEELAQKNHPEYYLQSVVDLCFMAYWWRRLSPKVIKHRLFNKELLVRKKLINFFKNRLPRKLRLLKFPINYDFIIKKSPLHSTVVKYLQRISALS